MNISSDTYYRLRNELVCMRSRTRRCFRQYPQQLSLLEEQVIDNAVNDSANFGLPLSTVFFQLLRAGKLFCALSTFYKYVPKIIREQKQKAVRESLKAAFPFEMLHVDVTEIITEYGKQKVAFIKDNFSKAILNFAVLPSAASVFIRDLFEQTFSAYRIGDCVKHVSIVSDGGSENKGELLVWIAQQLVPEVRKLTSGIDVRSNSMSESIHHTLKNEYRLRFGVPRDVDDLVKLLQEFVHYMNHEKFPIDHYGYSCWEVLHGAKPDRKRFAVQMSEAKALRLEENRSVSCLKGIGCLKM
jgi:transposase InsO family protein